tara:strand:+ start:682 stop:981 length:300 start_codon:yes stop_codon:yes gene_type:complete
MANKLLILFLGILFFILLIISRFYKKRYERSVKKTTSFKPSTNSLKEKDYDPDINTDNWDLHKLRLDKYRRSQYKGLTFFVSSEERIYYLSENGTKVYC